VKGKIWRVGLMGYCSQKPFVLLFLAALEKCLLDQGSACRAARAWERRFGVTRRWRPRRQSADKKERNAEAMKTRKRINKG